MYKSSILIKVSQQISIKGTKFDTNFQIFTLIIKSPENTGRNTVCSIGLLSKIILCGFYDFTHIHA